MLFGGIISLFLPLWFNISNLTGSFSCGFENFVLSSFSIDMLIMLILFLVFELELYYIILMVSVFLFVILIVIVLELVNNVIW